MPLRQQGMVDSLRSMLTNEKEPIYSHSDAMSTVVGVPRQEMPSWMLKSGRGDDQSTEVLKRDQAVAIFASSTEAEFP